MGYYQKARKLGLTPSEPLLRSPLGYKNEKNGAQTSNTSVAVKATVGVIRVGASADPVAVARALFR